MTKFKNLKIEINDQQPLDEVVRELERLGYIKEFDTGGDNAKHIEAYSDGVFDIYCFGDIGYTTTLTDLKNME